MDNVTKNVIFLRKKDKKSQRELADFLSVSVQCVSNWENGIRKIGVDYLQKIGEFFNISVDFLLADNLEELLQFCEDEKTLVDLVEKLTEEEQKELSNYIDFLLSKRVTV